MQNNAMKNFPVDNQYGYIIDWEVNFMSDNSIPFQGCNLGHSNARAELNHYMFGKSREMVMVHMSK